jgi:hypothetical protein
LGSGPGSNGDANAENGTKPDRGKPKGRRDLSVSKLPKVVVEFTDPDLAKKGRLIGWDESRQLMRDPGGFKVLIKRTAKYELPATGGGTTVLGVPHHRLEQHLASEGERLDRGTMCRCMEELGGTLGATVVHAMIEDARAHCGVLSTDATGAAIQPGSREGGPKQPCKKGHFFTIVADTDHVLFHYVERHTSDAVAELFKGFTGYLQSDASSVYDILDRGPPDANDTTVTLVGCWAHYREPRVIRSRGRNRQRGAPVGPSARRIAGTSARANEVRRPVPDAMGRARGAEESGCSSPSTRRTGSPRARLTSRDAVGLIRRDSRRWRRSQGRPVVAPDKAWLPIMRLIRRSG